MKHVDALRATERAVVRFATYAVEDKNQLIIRMST